jgi:hypothetical protein
MILVFVLLLNLSCLQDVRGNAELRALMEIRSSLDPENKYLTSWTSDGDPCSGSFVGVACNIHRKVANISLQGKGLAGSVPPAVAELRCLSGLYLHYNSLTGEIPKEISNLTELSDLYLNVNKLSGQIPTEIGKMSNLQVLQLCCNELNGSIPKEIGFLKKLTVLSLQHNKLSDQIPSSLGNLEILKRLDLSFNQLSGPIPQNLASSSLLEVLDVQNNTLSGVVPPSLKKLNRGFHYENNPGLCGDGFSSLRACSVWDHGSSNQIQPFAPNLNNTNSHNIPQPVSVHSNCSKTHCSNRSKLPKIAIFASVITLVLVLSIVGFMLVFRHRRRKQRLGGDASENSDDRTESAKEIRSRSASPLVALEYSNGWDPIFDGQNGNGVWPEFFNSFRFNLEEVESATQHFSESNLLGKSKFSVVYKGVLRDGSLVAIKCFNASSCKSEESEFVRGLSLLMSLRHENLVRLRGFCCSKGRCECFLIYDFASNGNLSNFLDGKSNFLDWGTRLSIIDGIAKGISYLHSNDSNKPGIIHQNISVKKVLLDEKFNPLIMDSGLLKLLADDIIFSALKISAALGYMAPEYVTTGRFTEKSDVYAFGVIILQILSGKTSITPSIRVAAECLRFQGFIDENLDGNFSENEAVNVIKIALACTGENPDSRPNMEGVISELIKQV